ncbi:hypothetical protein CU098_007723 [Rhizopus stolonifer]|uniref:Uncharacterized protein n=1 Tax=Rhizopus stolonifer TaxID=4846 RepID=A0A367KV55_RHIST|nr:hypothetical protein CU098_007723 [Rhizopus stolonifer]
MRKNAKKGVIHLLNDSSTKSTVNDRYISTYKYSMHIDYPLEVCGGIRTLVTSDLFRDTLCPVSVNANRLKTEDQWPLNDYIAFDIFMNIFR